jgi:imidazolonepropionase-like amidohydrolase
MLKPIRIQLLILPLLLITTLPNVSAASDKVKVIHAGRLLAVPGESPLKGQTIVLHNNRISKVIDGYQQPASFDPSAEFIDLSGLFVLPGLMDMHVHLMMELDADSRLRMLTESDALALLRGVQRARTTLLAGFTTVRDLGANPEAIYALRHAVEQGIIQGPRIFATGSPLAATGGHGDVDGVRPELMEARTPKTICDGPYDCRRATRHAIKYGADWIKVTVTGGVLSDTDTGLELQMSADELSEITATAHQLGRRVAVHAHGAAGIKAALNAGVDSIDHGTFMDKDGIRLMKKNKAWFVPTMLPGFVIKKQQESSPFLPPAIQRKLELATGAITGAVREAHRAGVKIAFGTDAGTFKHGTNAREFSHMVAAGMTPMDAIRAATVVAADLLNQPDQLGTIAPGKLADLIAVEGNPLEDVAVLESVRLVIKNGEKVQ